MIHPIAAFMLGARIVTRESYRRCLLVRILSGRFCDPVSAYDFTEIP